MNEIEELIESFNDIIKLLRSKLEQQDLEIQILQARLEESRLGKVNSIKVSEDIIKEASIPESITENPNLHKHSIICKLCGREYIYFNSSRHARTTCKDCFSEAARERLKATKETYNKSRLSTT